MASLDGKVAVVTGGARGIGRASAQALAEEGARVVIGDRTAEGATAAAETLSASGFEAIGIKSDVSVEADMVGLMDAAVDRFGRLDILHNNAANLDPEFAGRDGDIVELDVEVWDTTMAVNLRGTMLGCKHAIPRMLAQGGGAIVNTASMAAFGGSSVRAAYGSSKAAIVVLTQCVAAQYGKRGILCNAIAPGPTMTEAMLENTNEEIRAQMLETNLVPKFGQPEDMAKAVVFLASGGGGGYIQGLTLLVDGGQIANLGE